MNNPTPSPQESPAPLTQPSLWTDRPRIWIVGLIFLLLAGNVFFQIQAYLLGGGLIIPVLAGQLLGVFIPLLILSHRNGWNPLHDLRLGDVPWIVPAAAATLAIATLVPASLLAELSMRVFPSDPERIAMFQEGLPRSGWGIPLTFITVVLVGPLGEEIVFRGLLHRLASEYWSPAKATLLSALIFALVHAEPWLLLGLVGLGIALSFLYEVTGSLRACWIFHALHNTIALVMMYGSEEIQVEPSPIETSDYLWLALSLVAWLVIGTWLWKEKKPHKPT